ncbi:glycoside hydrolase family 31 [Catenulispora acidiphila DSM 44928]|uniref:Glycoside hydrolase family 31 n=1 Tax=Catenulispora acidiphila (strain DSM 44928 / JCM 14897 / NBRC 102108 / NRRL B-24433 / ID139908) TaxID=479433 RepID=C7QFT7_CATAD|nr:ricin-type beta-trefoil lectin domain protein [Catenulispora acidiphila]ACU70914.1 glycoside hydrolase family 31 [Catenulispora acidiphila DSM 44928]
MKPGAPGTDLPVPPPRGARRRRRKSARLAAAVGLLALAGTALYSPAAATAATAASSGKANATAASTPVLDGSARFEVLTPTLIRMEYAGDNQFQDAATFNAVNRSFPAVSYTTSVSGGYRVITTSSITLRYKEGSGPFTAANTSITVAGSSATAAPSFPSYCAFGTACEAEDGLLSWGASASYDHANHTGSGFVAGFNQVHSAVQQDVSAVPSSGTYQLSVRYANATGGDGKNVTRTLSTTVNGASGPTLSLPVTGSWDTWSTVSVPVTLKAGVNTVTVVQNASDSANVNLDSLAVTASGAAYPAPGASSALLTTAYGAGPTDTLGGWSGSLDNQNPATATERPGILDRDGWYLLDDSRSALLNANGTVTDRPAHGGQPYQDGYFFGYGTNYKQGLSDLNALTGSANLLPESAYGVWYSRYYAYSASDYENTLLPTFRSTFTPLDWLVVDTDWKAPNQWDGWNWNSSLFPDPTGFMNWTKQQGLETSLNIHTAISGSDPQFAAANSTAGGLSPDVTRSGDYEFDWSNPNQLAAYFNLHKPFEQQGVREWWLDYCGGCGNSTAGDPHVAPGNFINQAYAQDGTARGLRGFSFGRIGSSSQAGDNGNYALGPWSERRNTMQFTGDTEATWAMMALEAQFAGDEAAAGITNVSNDIGSFHGNHLADDMYARWVQLGTFQPVDRLHSDHGDRLPWNYGAAADASSERFLRLREALVPYTYTLADQAHTTGVPIIRPLYLDYPSNNEAYTFKQEYLYGDNVLVAPITTPDDANGNGSVSAWIPPGTWTDYFTGTSYTGPTTVTITDPLSQMPVLIKSGGIMPTRTNYVNDANSSPLTQVTLSVAAGADGSFPLYQDAGEGNGYQSGQSTTTPISWSNASRTLTIGADSGSFTGEATQRSYTLRLSNTVAPTAVSIDGTQVPETAWAYNPNERTTTVTTAALPVGTQHTISLTGSATANPAAGEVVGDAGLCLDTRGGTTANGTAMQLYTCNHTAGQQVAYTPGGALQVLGKCLDAANAGTANGTLIQLYDCNSTGSQNWTAQSNGELINPQSGRCLTVPGGNTTPGAVQLQLQDCTDAASQIWKLPPGPLKGPGGLCADVANADPSYATSVQLWGCNQSDAQRWYTPGDSTIRVFGKCLDVTNGGTANGTHVQLFDCNGSGSQNWTTQANGSLVNPQSGRCLDDPNNTEKAGDLLEIYDCNNSAAQQFSLGG